MKKPSDAQVRGLRIRATNSTEKNSEETTPMLLYLLKIFSDWKSSHKKKDKME